MHCGVLAKLKPVVYNNNSYITLCLIQIYELMVLYVIYININMTTTKLKRTSTVLDHDEHHTGCFNIN